MADTGQIVVRLKLANPRAARALGIVVRQLAELHEQRPYDLDLAKAVRAGKYLVKNGLVVVGEK